MQPQPADAGDTAVLITKMQGMQPHNLYAAASPSKIFLGKIFRFGQI